jgi:hypothetical protein
MNTPPKINPPERYRDSNLIRIGAAILVLGSGPLLAIIVAAKLGLTRDPNPNPVGFGMLAGCTFWPGIILLFVGVLTVWLRKRK